MKKKSIYSCQSCGAQSPKWMGKCADCGAWNSYVEEVTTTTSPKTRGRFEPGTGDKPLPLSAIGEDAEIRTHCGIGELDRVLGGGVVAGSLTLIGGDPGIGKSTLLLQGAAELAKSGVVLYVTAEESARQVKLRAGRLGIDNDRLLLLPETSLERIFERVEERNPSFLVIDSIQTIFTGEIDSAPGSVSQVRECTGRLMLRAKRDGRSTFLVGHVTKEGSIAGPRVLEHMVDTVLYFEGDAGHPYRILRAVKNRFGSTNEIGVFEMGDCGLIGVSNPSALFLAEKPEKTAGSVVVPAIEGTRPLLVEVQALVSGSTLGTPRRTTMGIDHNRVSLLVAVLEKKAGILLPGSDIFVNIAGGIRLNEPAADLGVAAAIASSHMNRPVADTVAIFGEVGLAGEVRAVSRPELRLQEAGRLGFKTCILPQGCLKNLTPPAGVRLIGVKTVSECLEIVFELAGE